MYIYSTELARFGLELVSVQSGLQGFGRPHINMSNVSHSSMRFCGFWHINMAGFKLW